MAARTVYEAVDAATSQAPNAGKTDRAARPSTPEIQSPRRATAVPAPRSVLHDSDQTTRRISNATRAAHRGVLAPVKRASRAVTLQITGTFFALFALSFAVAAGRFGAAQGAGNAHAHLWLCAALATLFAYFAISNFVRANRLSP